MPAQLPRPGVVQASQHAALGHRLPFSNAVLQVSRSDSSALPLHPAKRARGTVGGEARTEDAKVTLQGAFASIRRAAEAQDRSGRL